VGRGEKRKGRVLIGRDHEKCAAEIATERSKEEY
jgi:hypothetical protein